MGAMAGKMYAKLFSDYSVSVDLSLWPSDPD